MRKREIQVGSRDKGGETGEMMKREEGWGGGNTERGGTLDDNVLEKGKTWEDEKMRLGRE